MSNNKTLDETAYFEFLESKGLPIPNAPQMNIIRDFIAGKGDSKLSAEFFKVRACAGSGKTQLIVYTIIALIEQFKVKYYDIVVLAFNTKIAEEINTKLRNVFPLLKKDFTVAYTFHSFVSNYFDKNNANSIGSLYTTNSPSFNSNLYSIIQAKVIDLYYLNSKDFRECYDKVEVKYIPNGHTSRVVKEISSNVTLSEYLEFLGITSSKSNRKNSKKRLLCNEKTFRLNPDILRDYTMQGDLVDIPDSEDLSKFKKVVLELGNRLCSMGILYNLDIDLPMNAKEQGAKYIALITLSVKSKEGSSANSNEDTDSKKKTNNNSLGYIEIHSDDSVESLYSDSLRIKLGEFKDECFTKWTLLGDDNQNLASPIEGLDDFLLGLGFTNLTILPLDDLKEEIFINRIPDEITRHIVLTVERLRSECICTSDTAAVYENKLKADMERLKDDDLIFIKLLMYLLRPLFENTSKGSLLGLEDISLFTYARLLEYRTATVDKINSRKYLFVDEAQDVSDLFKEVLIRIIKGCPSIKVMFAGDSMQAINSFAGGKGKIFADLSILKKELNLNISIDEYSLPLTYRLSNNLAELANRFTSIQSLNDIACSMKSALSSLGIYKVYKVLSSVDDKLESFLNRIVFTIEEAWGRNSGYSVTLLARKHNVMIGGSLSRIRTDVVNRLIAKKTYKIEDILKITASTIHSFKGKEADVVIILDANESIYPMKNPFPLVQNYLFGDTEYSMEIDNRCLFYVAITRARYELYFLSAKPSEYLYDMGVKLSYIDKMGKELRRYNKKKDVFMQS